MRVTAGTPASSRALAGLVIVSFALYSAISILRWQSYELDSYDLAVYHQVVWQLSHFSTPSISFLGGENYFGVHFSPMLALLAPLYWVVASPALLLLAQAGLVAAAIPPVYLYARQRVSERCALLLALAYSQCWGVWAAVGFAIHEAAFAAPLIAWAIYLADRRRWRWAYICLAALLLVKENNGLLVAAFGLVLVARGERRRGLVIALCGLVAVAVINGVVIPAINGGGWSRRDAALYSQYGSSPSDAARYLATHPVAAASGLVDNPEKVRVLALLVGGFASLPLLSGLAPLALVKVAERLLSNSPELWAPSYHYWLVPMTILAMGSADGVARLTRMLRGRSAIPEALAMCAVVLSVGSALASPLGRSFEDSSTARSEAVRDTNMAAIAIPRAASVAADWATLTHLPPRRGMFLIPQADAARSQYLLVRERTPGSVQPGYRLVRSFGATYVYERRAGGA